jgi:hypothetical protein
MKQPFVWFTQVWFGQLARSIAAVAVLVGVSPAQAGYFQWDAVELPASSGASCGNGTPYRFFVNRTPFSRNTVVVYEGGGACWDQAACLGQGKLSASNPDGVPANYFSQLNAALGGSITPFTSRLNPFDQVRTQGWNLVYLPYCTGDVHTGSKVTVYSDSDPANPRVQYHRGQANIRGAAQWLRANVGRPGELLLTGFSAGGVGPTATYALMRDTMQPTQRSSLIADSGPLFPAPRTSTPAQSPSILLHNRIRQAWGLDDAGGLVTQLASLPGFDSNNMGSVNGALATRYPQDRFGYMLFQADGNFSAFSYAKFYPEIINAPDDNTRRALINQKWRQDINQWLPTLAASNNVGYWVPFWRLLNDSHCLTVVEWSGTGIEERGYANIKPFVENVLDRNGAPMREYETDNFWDYFRPVNPIQYLAEALRWLFG